MKQASRLILSTSPPAQTGGKPPGLPAPRCRKRLPCRGMRRMPAVKELDSETGLYYYGARYLDPKTGRWLSGDPAVGGYIPSAPVNDEARKRNGSLPGQGGVFNVVNLHVYHYAGNNPVKYVDPDGRSDDEYDAVKKAEGLKTEPVPNEKSLPGGLIDRLVNDDGWIDITNDEGERNDAARDIREKVLNPENEQDWGVLVSPASEYDTTERPRSEAEGGNLRGEGGRPLPNIRVTTRFNGTIYRIYPLPIERRNNKLPTPIREYYDVDGNGRIDLIRIPKQ